MLLTNDDDDHDDDAEYNDDDDDDEGFPSSTWELSRVALQCQRLKKPCTRSIFHPESDEILTMVAGRSLHCGECWVEQGKSLHPHRLNVRVPTSALFVL